MDKNDANKIILERLSMVSQEIKIPLNMISATTKLIRMMLDKDVLTADNIDDYIEKISNNCDKIEVIVNNIETKQYVSVSEYQLININEFVEKFAAQLEEYANELEFEFKYKINVKDDLFRIPVLSTERVLLNLITNSVKFNDKNKKTITLKITQDDDYLYFCIKDNGEGISKEDLDKVTDMFYRKSGSNSVGIGLGLSLVKDIIEAAGGNLTINSTLNKGTEITFSIPLKTRGKIKLRGSDYKYKPNASQFKIEFSSLQKNK